MLTDEQLNARDAADAAEELARKYHVNYSWQFRLDPCELAHLIAHVRAEAHNDALASAAAAVDACYYGPIPEDKNES